MLAFILEILVFFTGYIFHEYLPDKIFITLMFICNTWYIASLYITIVLLTFELLHLVNKRWAWYPMFINTYWSRTKVFLFFFVIIGIILLMIMGYRNVKEPVVQHVYITIPKDAGDRDSLTIVMTSDWHVGEMIGKDRVQHNVKLINEQNADMILVVGNIVDYESRFAEKDSVEKDFAELKAPLGIYAILGNHEYRANRFAKLNWIRKTGMTLLIDSVTTPADSSFYIIGRDNFINYKKRASLQTLMQHVDTLKPIIVLDHQPNRLNEIVMNKADLGLHGYTHNGQIWPYSLLLHLVYECPYGYYRKGETQFFVSSGIGSAGPPYRIGTRSEIVVLHIRFKPKRTSGDSN
jgi:predicted MPP superfamily phosphohydrolase